MKFSRSHYTTSVRMNKSQALALERFAARKGWSHAQAMREALTFAIAAEATTKEKKAEYA